MYSPGGGDVWNPKAILFVLPVFILITATMRFAQIMVVELFCFDWPRAQLKRRPPIFNGSETRKE